MGLTSALAADRDRRILDRQATALRAKVFPGAVDCIVADFNKRGARLRFAAPIEPDPTFVLVIWSSGLAFEVERRWGSSQDFGVRFVASRDLRRPAPPHMAEIQSIWMKRRPRVTRRTLIKQAPIIQTSRRRGSKADWMVPR